MAQRAYLVIRNFKVNVLPGDDTFVKFGGPVVAAIDYTFEIHNLGHTPASVLDYDLKVQAPDGWKVSSNHLSEDEHPFRETSLGDVAQGDKMLSRPNRVTFNIPLPLWEKWVGKDEPVKSRSAFPLRFSLNYRDVFSDEHQVNWCWFVFIGTKSAAPMGDSLAMECRSIGPFPTQPPEGPRR